jgi:hypothetical protein
MGSLTRPLSFVPPKGGRSAPKVHLVQTLVFPLLVADVLTDHLFVAADGGDEETPGPEVLPDEVAFALAVSPCQMDRALPLDEPDHL